MRGLRQALMVSGLAVVVVGCYRESSPPLASVPFDASRVGRSVTIPVTVTVANANLDHIYMVGFYIRDESSDGPAEQMRGYPPKQKLYLRVRVFQDVDGRDSPVVVNDRDVSYDIRTGVFSHPPSMRDRHTDVAYVSPSGQLNGIAHKEVVYFRFPGYGRYRIQVSTVSDMPMLACIPAWLTVEREFPHGK